MGARGRRLGLQRGFTFVTHTGSREIDRAPVEIESLLAAGRAPPAADPDLEWISARTSPLTAATGLGPT